MKRLFAIVSSALRRSGAAALIVVILSLFAAGTGCAFTSVPTDCTDKAPQVVSISYVRVDALKYGGKNGSDLLEYTVLAELDSFPAEELLKSLASLKYKNIVFGEPFFVRERSEGILVRFDSSSSDQDCVLYCKAGYLSVVKCERGLELKNYGPYCSEAQWNRLMEKYLPQFSSDE